jgi:hypothetical protein
VAGAGVLDELADGDEDGGDEFLVAGSSYRLNVRGGRYRRNRDGRTFFRSQVRERWR